MRFLEACNRQPVDCTPVWFMRQAGRYMAEYRELRRKHSILEICRSPELAVEVTLQPVERLGVDAAILFSDLLVPLVPMGFSLEFIEGTGPQLHPAITCENDVVGIRRLEPTEDLDFVLDAIRLLRSHLEGKIPLIGFAGAPFTLASYLIEGGPSRSFEKTKTFMYSEPRIWHLLASKLAHSVKDYLLAQIEAGAQAVQLFDSWVGALSPEDYRTFALPHSRFVLSEVSKAGVPVIHFGTGTSGILELLKDAGGTVLGLDWRIDLDEGWERVGKETGIQGNLDPQLLFAPIDVVRERAGDILSRAGGRPGHIFNLGHGILPGTPVDTVKELVEYVHQVTSS